LKSGKKTTWPFHSTCETEQATKAYDEQKLEETLLYIQQEDCQKELLTR